MPEMPETMESIEAIISTLEMLRIGRSPISVSPLQTKELFTSYILKISDNQILIDQLIPEHGNSLLQPGKPVDIQITHKGITYLFRSEHLLQSTDHQRFPYHEITLPAYVQYREKRSSLRIHLKLAESPAVKILAADGKIYQALLEDISTTGASIRLKGNHSSVKINDTIDCKILLDDLGPLNGKAIIRQLKCLAKTNEAIAGIEFSELPIPTIRKLHKVLMKLQRRNIRTNLTI